MANWNGLQLTNKGIALQAKVQAGEQLVITKLKLGSGVVPSGTDIKTLTDLIVPEQNLGIGAKEAVGDYCKVSSTISNVGLSAGYYVRELGVFAQDPDDGEILYLYTTDGAPDYLPAGGGSTVISQEFSVMIAVDDADNVKVEIDAAALATMGYVQLQIAEHDADESAHEPAFGEHNADIEAHPNFADANTRLRRSSAYAVGDIAYSANLPSWARLECVTAGTTAASEPSFTSVSKMGVYITDGTCKWIVDDIRFNIPVGVVFYDSYLHDGCVKANGATVTRADYVRLSQLATAKSLWTSSTSTEPYKYGTGNGSTTMVLPDYRNRVIQGGDNTAIIAAGLPNITGSYEQNGMVTSFGNKTGAYGGINTVKNVPGNLSTGDAGVHFYYSFNASLSNNIYGSSDTVQPPALQLIPQIRY